MSNFNNEGSSPKPAAAAIDAAATAAAVPKVESVQAAPVAGVSVAAAGTPVVAGDVPAPAKYQFGGTPVAAPFMQAQPGDKIFADPADLEGVDKDASQVYRDKYAEVMRNFQAGTLRSALSHVVRDRDEARTIAADQARQFDASTVRKAVL
jgi:hypothetical protein